MQVGEFIRSLESGCDVPVTIAARHTVPPRPARFAPYPDWIHAGLRSALEARGILELYDHQRRAADLLHARKHVVVATPTASGKSLCYHIPVLDHLFREGGDARALYLFPTKALARDQMAELERILQAVEREDLTVAV